MKQNSVESRIIEVANNPINSKLNLVQYKKDKAKALKHKEICEAVVAFKSQNKYMPMYAILSVGICSSAVKNKVFEEGYRHFDKEKCQKVYDMSLAFNAAIGKADEAPNDVAYRVAEKYYKKVSESVEDFKTALKEAGELNDSREAFHYTCKALGIESEEQRE